MASVDSLSGFGAAATIGNAMGAAQSKNAPILKHTTDPAAADKAGHDFEGWMIGQMLQPMFKSVKTDKMFGGGYGEDSFKELLIDEYGKKVAQSGGLGIAAMVRSEILKTQEAAS
jgi:Rod binding domain-containing protein